MDWRYFTSSMAGAGAGSVTRSRLNCNPEQHMPKRTWRHVTWRADVTWHVDVTWPDVLTWRDVTYWRDVTCWRDVTWRDVTWRDVTYWRDVTWRDGLTLRARRLRGGPLWKRRKDTLNHWCCWWIRNPAHQSWIGSFCLVFTTGFAHPKRWFSPRVSEPSTVWEAQTPIESNKKGEIFVVLVPLSERTLGI